MDNKNKTAFFIFLAINALILFILIVPLMANIMDGIAPYLYYSYSETKEKNIKITSTWGNVKKFSTGDEIKDTDIPWFNTIYIILFFALCGPQLLLTSIIYKKLGFKLP